MSDDSGDPRRILIENDSIDLHMIKHVIDSLDDSERLAFLMHQVVIHCLTQYKTPKELQTKCLNANKAIPLKVPPKLAFHLVNLCKTQSVMSTERMLTTIMTEFFIMGIEAFASTIGLDDDFQEMHKAVSAALGGVLDTGVESKKS